MSAALDHLAARVATDPMFLACALAEYARSAQLDDAGLVAKLGCPADALAPLRLCGVPRADRLLADVTTIAERFGIDPGTLAEVVRRGQVLSRLRGAAPGKVEPSFLLAARDDDRAPPPPEEEPPP